MIDSLKEQVYPLRQICRFAPGRGGKPLSLASAHRWARHGIRGVLLETLQCGGQLCSSREALQRFFAKLSELDQAPAPSHSPAKNKSKSDEYTKRELDSLGI